MEKSINTNQKILIGTIVKNCGQWIRNLFINVAQVNYPKENISIAILENDSDDNSWKILKQETEPLLKSLGYRKVTIEKIDFGFNLKHSSRHIPTIQKERANCITRARQHIINKHLADNDYIWWVDADLERIPPDTLKILLMCKCDSVSPVYRTKDGKLYDGSSHRKGKMLKELLDRKEGEDLIEIDGTNCQALMHRRVFDAGADFWVDGEVNSNYTQSQRMKRMGIKFYIMTKVTVLHHTICGTKPL